MWFEAASWCFSQGIDSMTTEGEQFLDKGIANNPESVLLAMTKADRVESSLETGNTDEILIRNGEKLDVPYEQVHTALYALRSRLKEKDDKTVAQINAHFASLSPEEEPESAPMEDDDDEPSNRPNTRAEQMKAAIDAVKLASAAHMDLLKRTISYVWVAKMRAFRRVQGQGKPPKKGEASAKIVKGFRGIFSDARPRGPLSSDVYIASALMEWRCYKDPSAIKIFERGMKLFPLDEAFILEYVKHLIALSDVTNARVVFESTIPKIMNAADFTPEQKRERCRPLFTFMHDYESKYGDLAQIHKIEKRMAELYPEEMEESRFSHRFSLPDFDAMHVQLVLSPTQARPRVFQHQQPAPQQAPAVSIENAYNSPKGAPPEILLGPNGPYVASPKRPLEDSDNEQPQRKFMRGESPLKGAAGLRIQSKAGAAGGGGFATKTFVPNSVSVPSGPPPLPPMVEYVLRQIPGARDYNQARFDAVKMAYLAASIDVDSARAALNRGELHRR
jgi:cleavage stimulation factor subunit 3